VLCRGLQDHVGGGRRRRWLVPLSALVHGSWLVTRSLSLPEADWIAVVWVANAGALAVLQMLTLVDSARCYAQHLERERAVVEETLERRYEFERRMVELSTRFVRLPPRRSTPGSRTRWRRSAPSHAPIAAPWSSSVTGSTAP
jgi:hypothetical protein